jgi:hypothetical protein
MFYGPDPKKVIRRFTEFVGRSPLPPRWSLGYYPEPLQPLPGISFDYQHGIDLRQQLTARQEANGVRVEISAWRRSFKPPKRALVVEIHDRRVEPRRVVMTRAELPKQASVKALKVSTRWTYDDNVAMVLPKLLYSPSFWHVEC